MKISIVKAERGSKSYDTGPRLRVLRSSNQGVIKDLGQAVSNAKCKLGDRGRGVMKSRAGRGKPPIFMTSLADKANFAIGA
jgi:hypothetical protein